MVNNRQLRGLFLYVPAAVLSLPIRTYVSRHSCRCRSTLKHLILRWLLRGPSLDRWSYSGNCSESDSVTKWCLPYSKQKGFTSLPERRKSADVCFTMSDFYHAQIFRQIFPLRYNREKNRKILCASNHERGINRCLYTCARGGTLLPIITRKSNLTKGPKFILNVNSHPGKRIGIKTYRETSASDTEASEINGNCRSVHRLIYTWIRRIKVQSTNVLLRKVPLSAHTFYFSWQRYLIIIDKNKALLRCVLGKLRNKTNSIISNRYLTF